MTVQPFVNYNFEKGWYVSSGPIITANWAAHGSDNTWTVPVGGGFGRIIRIGKLPVNLGAQAFEWSSPTMIRPPTGRCACRSSSCSRNDAAACYVGRTVRKET